MSPLPAWLASTATPAELEAWEERSCVAEYTSGLRGVGATPAARATSLRLQADKLATDCLLAARQRAQREARERLRGEAPATNEETT